MSAHNHDEEIIRQFSRTRIAKQLDKKVSKKLNDDIVNAILNHKVLKGKTRDERSVLPKVGHCTTNVE